MNKNSGKKFFFLSLEFLGVFAGIWAFIFFFKALSSKILGKMLGGESALTTLLQQFFSGVKWVIISLFALVIVYLVRKIKSGWKMEDLGFSSSVVR